MMKCIECGANYEPQRVLYYRNGEPQHESFCQPCWEKAPVQEHLVIPAIVASVEERQRLLNSRIVDGRRVDTTVSAGIWLTVMLSGGGAQLSFCIGEHTTKYKTGDLINIRLEPRS